MGEKMKFLIFGTGLFYENRKYKFKPNEIIGFIDNDSQKWGQKLDNIKVYKPSEGIALSYDKIILMSTKKEQMRKQLIDELGVKSNKLMLWEDYVQEGERRHLEIYYSSSYTYDEKSNRILIISEFLNYNGGSLAAIYAAKALQLKDYEVVLAAPGGNLEFIREQVDDGLTIFLYHNLNYDSWEDMSWMKNFSFMIVNTFQMLPVVCTVCKHIPLFWWIHEPHEVYDLLNCKNCNQLNKVIKDIEMIDIYAVSRIAANIFKSYFNVAELEILPYAIPDKIENNCKNKTSKKFIFAIVGQLSYRKAHDIFLNAIEALNDQEKKNVEFWIIGGTNKGGLDSFFYDNVIRKMKEIPQVKLWGVLSRKEIENIYPNFDVLVIPSREETMSIVATEGMMYGKVCIISENTGMASYIQNGKNGLICKCGSVSSLQEQMQWVLKNKDKLNAIGKNARQTYEENFTMDKFGNKLVDIIKNGK